MFNSIRKSLFCLLTLSSLLVVSSQKVQAQLLPQVWATVGVKDSDVSYGAGVKAFGFGVEVGTGKNGATGGDVLKFINLPFVSPYVGIGYYSGDENFAYSVGAHFDTSKNVFLGAGYHSIRGINGQIGFKF
jgi:hypothetical protein